MENIEHIRDEIWLRECDMTDPNATESLVKWAKPNIVFHLAAQSFVGGSWDNAASTIRTNIYCQLNLLEAIRKLKMDVVVIIAGSSEEYGIVTPEECPIRETAELKPTSPYGLSKVAQDLMGRQYYESYGMRIIRCRAFNHEGPRRGEQFVISNFAKQIVEIENGMKEPVIDVGNLDSERDFTDVRDVIRAYWLLAEKGDPGDVYNICSGISVKIKDVLQSLIKQSAYNGNIDIKPDESRMRPSDIPFLRGSNEKIAGKIKWNPVIQIDETWQNMMAYWRLKIKSKKRS